MSAQLLLLLAPLLAPAAAEGAARGLLQSSAMLDETAWWTIINSTDSFCDFAADEYHSTCADASATDVFCTSLSSYYDDNCAESFEDVLSDDMSLGVSLLMTVVLGLWVLIRELEVTMVQGVAAATVAGLISGGVLLATTEDASDNFTFDNSIFFRLMIPFIIFHAGLELDKSVGRTYTSPILLLASLGTLVSTFVIGFFVWALSGAFGTQLPFIESLIFGCLISSIDPCMTLSMFQHYGVRDQLNVLVSGESLVNDGIVVPLFHILLGFVGNDDVTGEAVGIGAVEFFATFLGSIAVGAAGAVLVTLFFKAARMRSVEPAAETCLFIIGSMLPYYIADILRWSGIVAVLASSIMVDLLCYSTYLSPTAQAQTKFVTHCLSFVMELGIFSYIGVFMVISPGMAEVAVGLAVLAIAACILSRFASVGSCTAIVNHAFDPDCGIDKPTFAVLWFSGMRGSLSWALAMVVPPIDQVTGAGSEYAGEIVFMTGTVIMFYVLVTGGALHPFLTRMNVLKNAPAAPFVDRVKAVVGAVRGPVVGDVGPQASSGGGGGGVVGAAGAAVGVGGRKKKSEKWATLLEEEHAPGGGGL